MAAVLHEVGDGVFAWIHDLTDAFTCNVGVIVGDGFLTVVDASGVPSSYGPLRASLAGFGRPIRRVILTHGHGDHVAGVQELAPDEVVTSIATAAALAQPPAVGAYQALNPGAADEIAGLTHPLPTRILDGPTDLDGRVHIDVLRGHTAGDIAVSVPDADVVFAGDLCFFGMTPLGFEADLDAWSATLAGDMPGLTLPLAGLVVPGHGPIGSPDEVAAQRRYLDAVRAAARAGVAVPDGPWRSWWHPWREVAPDVIDRINVERAAAPETFPPTLMRLAGYLPWD